MAETCRFRAAAMDVDGWGYVECELDAGHPLTEGLGAGHRFSAIVHDHGAYRLANLPSIDPAETACPTCGCDVTNCSLTVLDDGRRRWMQNTRAVDKGRLEGGLVHVENGRRCLADAAARMVNA